MRTNLLTLLLLGCPAPDDVPSSVGRDPTDDPPEPSEDTDVPDETDPPRAAGETWTFDGGVVTLSVQGDEASTRVYGLTTSSSLRDDVPPRRTVAESPGGMALRSGDLLLDALFALALDEAREASVSSITDGAFANGAGVPCDCFETGEKWRYVWTRDTAYAVDLGLALVDPRRSARSLRFKLSRPKGGGSLAIVQDTGSGGSWPVSTDRVVWAVGAREALRFLQGAERDAFAADTLEALATTIAVDRAHVWDPEDGLYRGEQSFLDWREQSYGTWTAGDVTYLAESKALSTNVGHLEALRLAAALGAEVDHPDATTWAAWADDLAAAIRGGFGFDGRLATVKGSPLSPEVLDRYDLLGQSLAILGGVLKPEEARAALTAVPRSPHGPPVLWPQQPGVRVYHNRGIWPFVTAYDLLAARAVGHDAAFDADVDSLVRGAALNLSNMENLELLTGQPWVDEGSLSGPVVNSRRQLWSVAGFVGMVVRGILGLETSEQGVRVVPFVTAGLRARWLTGSEVLLRRLPLPGATVDVRVVLPAQTIGGGAYAVASAVLDGIDVTDVWLDADRLSGARELVVNLTPTGATAAQPVRAAGTTLASVDAPPEPGGVAVRRVPSGLEVSWSTAGGGATWEVWRDGERVAEGLGSPFFVDAAVDPDAGAPCYTVAARRDGRVSSPSRAVCWWGDDAERVLVLDAHALVPEPMTPWSSTAGRVYHRDWGAPDHVLVLHGLQPPTTGEHALQLEYANGAGAVNTGITAGHKLLRVVDEATGDQVAVGHVVMPHTGAWDRWADSTLVSAWLDAARTYRVEIVDAPNMSTLDHFTPYTGGNGGGDRTFGFVDIHALKVLARSGPAPTFSPTIALDGVDDLDKLGGGELVVPGAPLETWERFGVAWDDRWLYVAVVSRAFREDFAPAMIYLQAGDGDLGEAVPAEGAEYVRGSVGAPAALPFTPTHLVTLRARSAATADEGPWNGVWARAGGSFSRLRRFADGRDGFLAADRHTLSARIPLSVLGRPERLRLVAHVVWGEPGNEWKGLVPAGHTPWDGGGEFLELVLE